MRGRLNETSFHMGDTSGTIQRHMGEIQLDVVASKQEPPVAPSPSASQAAIGDRMKEEGANCLRSDAAPEDPQPPLTSITRRILRVLMYLCLVLALEVILWYMWNKMARDSLETPIEQMLRAMLIRAETTVHDILRPAELMLQALTATANSREMPNFNVASTGLSEITSEIVKDPCQLIQYLVGLASPNSVTSVGVGFEDGTSYWAYWAANWGYAGDEILVDVTDPQNVFGQGPDFNQYRLNATGCVDASTFLQTVQEGYDCTIRPWYKAGLLEQTWMKYQGTKGAYAAATVGPIFARSNSSLLLGVILVDQTISGLNSKLTDVTRPGLQTYITETKWLEGGATDYLMATTSGVTHDEDGPVSPAQSSNPLIRKSYNYLMDHLTNQQPLVLLPNGTKWKGHVILPGDPYKDEPLIGAVNFDSHLAGFTWEIVVTMPWDSYYGWLYNTDEYYNALMWFTAAAFLVAAIVLALGVRSMCSGQPEPPWVIPAIVLIYAGLWVAWACLTQKHTEEAIEDALQEQTSLLALYTTTTWQYFFTMQYVSSTSYSTGLLDLNTSNTMLDTHFTNILKTIPQARSAYIGFPNGDFVGGARVNESPTFSVRQAGSSYGNNLVHFEAVPDASNTSLIRSSVVASVYGAFDSTIRPWYQAGVRCGRKNGTHIGNTCLGRVYITTGGSISLPFVQALYNDENELVGVLSTDLYFDESELKYFIDVSLPSPQSQLAIVQDKGELLQTSDGVNTRVTSGGQIVQLLMIQSSLAAISGVAVSLGSKYTSVSQMQNNSAFDNQYVTYTASMGDWTHTEYTTLPQETSTWTQIIISPRAIYFATLDKSLSESFATILFGSAVVLYIKMTFTSDGDNDEESTTATHAKEVQLSPMQSNEDIDHTLSEKDPLCMTDQVQLCNFVNCKLEPLVQQLQSTYQAESGHGCNISLRAALLQKAAFYIEYANAGNQVFPLMMLEGKFGQQSTQVKVFKVFCSRTATRSYQTLSAVFIMTICIPDYSVRLALDILLLTLISCFVALGAWVEYQSLEGSLRLRSKWAVAATATLWLFMAILVPLGVAPEVDAIVRVSMVFFASESLSAAFGVTLYCMWEVTTMIALYCTVIVLSANIVMLMYYNDLSPYYGETVDTFFDAFIAMYIFLESADNWEALVYNSYRVSHWGAIFFIPVAILGVFFLFSVLLALFEDAYASQTDEMLGLKRAKYRTALSTSFMLIVRHQELAEETTNNACKVLTKQAFATFMPAFGFDDLELVDKLFDLIDSDSNGFVDLTEFTQILFIARCHALMTNDMLLTHKVVVARWAVLVAEAHDLLDGLPGSQDSLETKAFLTASKPVLQRSLDEAQLCLDNYEQSLWRSFQITPSFSLLHLDQLCVLVLIGHAWAVTVYPQDAQFCDILSVCCQALYLAEITTRLVVMGGFQNFLNDPRGSAYTLQNVWALCSCGIGLVGAMGMLVYGVSGDPSELARTFRALMTISLCRIFVMHKGFRVLTRSFLDGLSAVACVSALLGAVYYCFCMVAHLAFKDLALSETSFGVVGLDKQVNFESLGETFLTMFQTFLGAGWSAVMRNTVSQTYISYYWFFIVYRFVVGLIFSQLLVGILVTSFQTTEAERGTITGEVRLALSKAAKVLTQETQAKLQRELGVLAVSLLPTTSNRNANTATEGKDEALLPEVMTSLVAQVKGDDLVARVKDMLAEKQEECHVVDKKMNPDRVVDT